MGNPYASVVICTTKYPEKVIECLERQTFNDFEVIIADEPGIVYAMNCALKRASGEIFIRIDDDVKIPKDWLKELIAPFKNCQVAGTTGPTFIPEDRRENRDSIRIWENPHWFLKWLCDGCYFNPAGIYSCGSVSYDSNYQERFLEHYGCFQPDHLEGTNWAMRTKLIKQVGGFDQKFDGVSEWFDTDVEQKIKKIGYKLVYNPKAYLYHMLDFTEHYEDRFNGIGRIKNWLRFHWRHSKFHPKMVIFLIVWSLYFIKSRLGKVSSGLVRRGWLSQGVSQTKRRTK